MKSNVDFPLITIQILNWNRATETVRAIESAINQSYPNFEVVVVDNGSTDGSVELISGRFPNLKIVSLSKNYGCPGGRNRGISECSGEYIFFCDNDGVLHNDAVKFAYEEIFGRADCFVVTGTVREFADEREIDVKYEIIPSETYKIHTFQGGICLIRKKVFFTIELFPDDYIYGGEEQYLSFRIMDKGYEIRKSENVILWHKKSSYARNVKNETLNSWRNKLANVYQLYPIEYFVQFLIYFVVVYPIYALKEGFFLDFLRSIPKMYSNMIKYKRIPVARKTFKTINHIRTMLGM